MEDRRFARLAKLHAGPRIDLLEARAELQVRGPGEDRRFGGAPVRFR